MKQAFLQLHLAVLLASCSGIFGNLISLDPVLITGYDAVGKCDVVTPFIHKVWQDYRW